MFSHYLNIFIPLLALTINVLVQVASFRAFPKTGLLNSVFFGFIAGLISLVFCATVFFIAAPTAINEFIAVSGLHLITYIALGYCYFHFINLGETARRIRILRELFDSRGGLSYNELIARYNAGEILDKRLQRLTDNGQIIFENGRYYIARPTMLAVARILAALKIILLGRKYA